MNAATSDEQRANGGATHRRRARRSSAPMLLRVGCLLVALCLTSTASAGVEYLPEQDVLWVTDFPEAYPCTPRLLARADAARGWDKVHYDEASRTCTVSCDLYIGRNDGSNTWFQVGSADRPEETLIVRGDLRVYSTWLEAENTESMYTGRKRTNRLTLGVQDDPSVRASLLIDNEEREGHTIIIGGFSGYGSENQGGDLCAYHATIGPSGEVPIGQRESGANHVAMGGSGTVEVIDCLIRGVAGRAFGSQFTDGRFERSRFENCGVAIHGNYQEILRDCTFVNCRRAIIAGSRNVLRLVDCTFQNNERNWAIPYQHTVAIDCTVDDWGRGSYSAEHDTFLVCKRHVIVKVVDDAGEAVGGATVKATTGQTPAAADFEMPLAKTGPDGLTPGEGEDGALLLSEFVIRAPEAEEGDPVRTDYRWTLEAGKGDRRGRVEDFSPGENWQTLEITIEQE